MVFPEVGDSKNHPNMAILSGETDLMNSFMAATMVCYSDCENCFKIFAVVNTSESQRNVVTLREE